MYGIPYSPLKDLSHAACRPVLASSMYSASPTEIGRASCRESEGKAKIEGYMSVSDEEAHQRLHCQWEKLNIWN